MVNTWSVIERVTGCPVHHFVEIAYLAVVNGAGILIAPYILSINLDVLVNSLVSPKLQRVNRRLVLIFLYRCLVSEHRVS